MEESLSSGWSDAWNKRHAEEPGRRRPRPRVGRTAAMHPDKLPGSHRVVEPTRDVDSFQVETRAECFINLNH